MAKSYREKRAAYDKMQGVSFFEPDMNILREKNPTHELCKRKYLKPEKCQKEALWALLDILTVDDIVKNRRAYSKKSETKRVKAGINEISGLLEKLMNAETLVAAKALAATITEKAEVLPADVKAEIVRILGETMPMIEDKLDPVKVAAKKAAERKASAIEGLLKIDIDTANQAVLANYAKVLGVTGKDRKATTLRPLLKEFLENLKPKGNEDTTSPKSTDGENDNGLGGDISGSEEKTDEGSGEQNTEVDSEELSGDDNKGGANDKGAEKSEDTDAEKSTTIPGAQKPAAGDDTKKK